MNDATTNADALPLATGHDVLTEVLRAGAQEGKPVSDRVFITPAVKTR